MDAKSLVEAILAFMERGDSGEDGFNELALRIFTYQFERNEPYRKFCLRRNKTPEKVSHWSEIPPVPTQAFKVLDLACEPTSQAQAIFLSSGTTQGEQKRSRHFIFHLRLYETSALRWFEPHLLPERKPMPIAILFPPPDELPNSSLGHMLATIAGKWGEKEEATNLSSGWFIRSGKLLAEGLTNWLKSAEESGQPIMLLGTSFSFVHFLDWCYANSLTFRLPQGSRLMDTGGFKGRSREVSRDELYRLYERVLGVSPEWCINEYGMAELSSQFYDGVVGRPYFASLDRSKRLHKPPHWVRTKALNPETLEEVGEGEEGLLCHYDLANLGSVMAVLTEDLGVKESDGFVLLGRAKGSELRGCSVLVDDLLSTR
ncbi:MAG: long-chain fatty acid--CoA ligase [Armatimonadota bacterium]|nr:long-chain fatty acid--CoA ligase [Armatimonadota bacterium]MDW8142065.1 long-chain fatty acid--CoA ligase [Armatimonadota bacterium]